MSEQDKEYSGSIAEGTGVVTRALASRLGPSVRYFVTNLDQPMVDHARSKQGAGDRITWQRADAFDLPFEDKSFDVAGCQSGGVESGEFPGGDQPPYRYRIQSAQADGWWGIYRDDETAPTPAEIRANPGRDATTCPSAGTPRTAVTTVAVSPGGSPGRDRRCPERVLPRVFPPIADISMIS